MTAPLGSAFRGFQLADGAATADAETFARALDRAADELDLAPNVAELANEIAMLSADLGGEDARALQVLVVATLVEHRRGGTRTPLDGDAVRLVAATVGRRAPSLAAEMAGVPKRIGAMVTSGRASAVLSCERDAFVPLVVVGGHAYHERLLREEERVANRLASALASSPAVDASDVDGALADVVARPAILGGKTVVLTAEQQAAVRAAAFRRAVVVSGGPGTGKTSIVVAIVRVLGRLGVPADSVVLAAPTGKAAFRMGESIAAALGRIEAPSSDDRALLVAPPAASTLHRLLGWSPARRSFEHHANNPLAADVVVVDEASMIDLFLMDRLLAALRPGARLVLLGDADQLPSVDAGAVLRDVVTAAERSAVLGQAVVRLRQSHRMDPRDPAGRAILTVAQRVNEGDAAALLASELVADRRDAGVVAWERVERVDGGAGGREVFLDAWFARHVAPVSGVLSARVASGRIVGEDREVVRRVLEHHARARLLAVTRVLPTGADALNRAMAARAADRAGVSAAAFLPGDPIIVTRNDYDRKLFNGDQGIVVRTSDERGRERLSAVFPRGGGGGEEIVAFPLDALRGELDLAYALTVHKSQGSELDHVALVLPDDDLPLLGRELVYTAITRSRRSVTIVGSREALGAAVRRRAERFSGMAESLVAAVEGV